MKYEIQITYKSNSTKIGYKPISRVDSYESNLNYQALEKAHRIALSDIQIAFVHVRREDGYFVGGYTRSTGKLTSTFSRA